MRLKKTKKKTGRVKKVFKENFNEHKLDKKNKNRKRAYPLTSQKTKRLSLENYMNFNKSIRNFCILYFSDGDEMIS